MGGEPCSHSYLHIYLWSTAPFAPTLAMLTPALAALLCVLPPPRSPPLQRETVPCTSCGEALSPARRVKHMSSCCPDALDPQGWRSGDQTTVLAHVEARYGLGSEEGRFLCLRFAGGDDGLGITTRAAAARARWPLRRARSVVAGALHCIPPFAEPDASLDVLYEDSDMVVVSKPAGVPVTPSHRLRAGSVTNRLAAHVGARCALELRPVHRLDLETSGVLCFAKSGRAATQLMRQFEQRQVRKLYIALCVGEAPGWEERSVDVPIATVAGEAERAVRRVCEVGEPGALEATTRLRVVLGSRVARAGAAQAQEAGEAGTGRGSQAAAGGRIGGGAAAAWGVAKPSAAGSGSLSLMLASPLHGRTHQVRLHCAAAGVPILGDSLYRGDTDTGGGHARGAGSGSGGDTAELGSGVGSLISRHALHALALRLRHPRTGAPLLLRAPLPPDMEAVRRQAWPAELKQKAGAHAAENRAASRRMGADAVTGRAAGRDAGRRGEGAGGREAEMEMERDALREGSCAIVGSAMADAGGAAAGLEARTGGGFAYLAGSREWLEREGWGELLRR
jgi:23S rRNA pseudouridine1911/1915/1917 synthase